MSLIVGIQESSDHIFSLSPRVATRERHENNLVTVEFRAIPTAVLSDECSAAIPIGETRPGVEGETERRNVRTQSVVGYDGLCHQIGALRMHAFIDVLTEIAVWPAIKPVFTD